MNVKLKLLPEEAAEVAAFLDHQRATRAALGWTSTLHRGLEYIAGALRHNAALAGAQVDAPTVDGRICEVCHKPRAVRYKQEGELPAGTFHARCRAMGLVRVMGLVP